MCLVRQQGYMDDSTEDYRWSLHQVECVDVLNLFGHSTQVIVATRFTSIII